MTFFFLIFENIEYFDELFLRLNNDLFDLFLFRFLFDENKSKIFNFLLLKCSIVDGLYFVVFFVFLFESADLVIFFLEY